MEKTLVLIKPDAMKRNLMGEIISIYQRKGLEITHLKVVQPSPELVKEHYKEHEGKPFFNNLVEFLTSYRVCAFVIEGERVIETVRKLNGATDPLEAELGTIRGKYATYKSYNVVHASDSLESANREIALWFPEI